MIIKAGKYLFTAILLSTFGFAASAQRMRVIEQRPGYYAPARQLPAQQRPYENVIKVRKLKEEFISKQLLLSPEQTNRFLTVYRRYEQELGAVRVLKRLNNSAASPNGSDQIDKDMDYERQIVDIKFRYKQEFLKIMPPEKVSMIYKSEAIFNDEVIKNLKERNAGTAPPPGY